MDKKQATVSPKFSYVKAVDKRRKVFRHGHQFQRGADGRAGILEGEGVEPRKTVDLELPHDGFAHEAETKQGKYIQGEIEEQSAETQRFDGAIDPEIGAGSHRNENPSRRRCRC